MHRILSLLIALVVALQLVACGGGGGTSAPAIIPEAHAAEPVSGCPTGDASTEVQAVFDTAPGVALIPPCVLHVTRTLTITKPITLTGGGARAGTIKSSACPAVIVAPEAAISQGWWLHLGDLRIEPEVEGACGGPGMVWKLKPGVFISRFTVQRLYIGDFGGCSLELDNSVGNENSFFTGVIEQSWFNNCVNLIDVGDSIVIRDNTITTGRYARNVSKKGWPGIQASGRGGARKLVIERNNITSSGGCIFLHDIAGPEVVGNICEHPTYYGLPFDSTQDGLIQLTNVVEADVERNSINLNGVARYGIAVSGGEQNSFVSNAIGRGTQGHMLFDPRAKDNVMSGFNRFRYSQNPRVGQITGAATGLLTNP